MGRGSSLPQKSNNLKRVEETSPSIILFRPLLSDSSEEWLSVWLRRIAELVCFWQTELVLPSIINVPRGKASFWCSFHANTTPRETLAIFQALKMDGLWFPISFLLNDTSVSNCQITQARSWYDHNWNFLVQFSLTRSDTHNRWALISKSYKLNISSVVV